MKIVEIGVIADGQDRVLAVGKPIESMTEKLWSPEPYCHRTSVIVKFADGKETEWLDNAINYITRVPDESTTTIQN